MPRKKLSHNMSVRDLVEHHDGLTAELEASRLKAEEHWSEYQSLCDDMVRLESRYGVGIRRYKELGIEPGKSTIWQRVVGAIKWL